MAFKEKWRVTRLPAGYDVKPGFNASRFSDFLDY